MSDEIKTFCSACNGHLSFPAELLGTDAWCPHCGHMTKLTRPKPQSSTGAVTHPAVKSKSKEKASATSAPAAPAAKKKRKKVPPGICPSCESPVGLDDAICIECGEKIPKKIKWFRVVGFIVVGLLLLVILLQWTTQLPGIGLERGVKAKILAKIGIRTRTASGKIATEGEEIFIKDGHKLAAEEGGNFRFVRGTVQNNSAHRFMGVRIEIEMLNKNSEVIGRISDYTQSIEPWKSWEFKALVVDPDAAAYKLLPIDARR
ncbi:MAG: hypothetical protein EXS24_04160 [Pedosphaera sp.]|nr:hypothetical protein [Pedosphaera sp.]